MNEILKTKGINMNDNIEVKVTGKNVNNYIKWLVSKKVNVKKINILSHNEVILIIDNKYYKLLNSYSKTYKISILKKYGKLKLLELIKKNLIIIISIFLSLIFLYFLYNNIFSIDVISNDEELSTKIKKELENYDIKKYRLKKDYEYLEKVEENILNNNKDTLEWIEIENSGTKYIVKLVERKKEVQEKSYQYQSIVASKDAIIKNIKAISGEKIKTINQYVKKDEVIISGILVKPDQTNIYTKAQGVVYGEVWYEATIEYPLYYQEESVTGKSKNVISLYFFDKKISLFPYKQYKQFKTKTQTLIENNYIPIKVVKEKLYEVNIKEEIYTEEEAIDKAIELGKKKLQEKNDNIIEFNEVMVSDVENLNSKIKVKLFMSVTENITKIVEVKEEKEQKEQ